VGVDEEADVDKVVDQSQRADVLDALPRNLIACTSCRFSIADVGSETRSPLNHCTTVKGTAGQKMVAQKLESMRLVCSRVFSLVSRMSPFILERDYCLIKEIRSTNISGIRPPEISHHKTH
jgi:hypothetical protein